MPDQDNADERAPLLTRHPSAVNTYARIPTYDLVHRIRRDLLVNSIIILSIILLIDHPRP